MYSSRLSKLPFQPFTAVKVSLSPVSTPSASNLIVTLVGLFPSWSFLSSQAFVTLILVLLGVREFLTLYPSTIFVYPVTSSSSILYLISLPFSYFGKSLNSYFHLPSVPFETSFVSTTIGVSFSTCLSNLTLIFVGRFPSWLSLSSQVFSPAIFTFSVCLVFIILNSVSDGCVIKPAYPFPTSSSSIE